MAGQVGGKAGALAGGLGVSSHNACGRGKIEILQDGWRALTPADRIPISAHLPSAPMDATGRDRGGGERRVGEGGVFRVGRPAPRGCGSDPDLGLERATMVLGPLAHRMKMSEQGPWDLVHSEEFLSGLKRRQLRLSIGCALAFLVVLLAMPALNYLAPEWMAREVAGFTLSWLVLGVLFFPFVWGVAWVFIRRSIRLEEAEVARARSGQEDGR